MTVRLPAGTHAALTDMLCNPMQAADPLPPIVLEQGRPVYVLTSTPGVEQLAAALKDAEASLRAPVDVTATRTADGRLQVALHSKAAGNVDLRVSVGAPGLFSAAPAAVGVADLGSDETRILSFDPDRSPAAGTDVPVSVKIEFGSYAIVTTTSKQTVRF
jgi:hypothetical protein